MYSSHDGEIRYIIHLQSVSLVPQMIKLTTHDSH
jgi:hypothetical protein